MSGFSYVYFELVFMIALIFVFVIEPEPALIFVL